MNEIATKIKDFFEKNEWKYLFDEKHSVFNFGLSMGGNLGSLDFYIIVKDDSYTVYAILNNKAELDNINQVAEYLHRANYGLRVGNFELDYDDGEIRYKNYVDADMVEINEKNIMMSIFIPADMFNKYGKGLLEVIIGKATPKEMIDIIESQKDD